MSPLSQIPPSRLRIDPQVAERFPEYSALVIYAAGLVNGHSDSYSTGVLRAAEREAREAFGHGRAADHPHIAAWRRAFAAFGAKPSKYPCSAEALLSRVLKGGDLPGINRAVDLYNAVSVRRVLPAGGEDRDKLVGDLVLTLARGTEPFDALGDEGVTHPSPGEVVWVDSVGVTCRRWNWRQGKRTMLTEATRNAYFVFDRLDPHSPDELHASGDELLRHLQHISPGAVIDVELLGARA